VTLTEPHAHAALAPIMAASRAVAEGRALEETLSTIAEAGAALGQAKAAAIVLRHTESATGLSVAGAYGLSPEYAEDLNRVRPLELGYGPSGTAAATRQPVVVSDVFTNPIFEPWRDLAAREGYRAMVSVPLMLGTELRVIGVLNAYRGRFGGWSDEQLELLGALADHAAIAIQTAQLLEDERLQVRGLSLVARSLRAQTHEHANLIHALYGLLTMDAVDEARNLIAVADERHEGADVRLTKSIDSAVISGFLLAEAAIAANAGIALTIEVHGRLAALPGALEELDLITILGNLIQNATEAVQGQPDERRRVTVTLRQDDDALSIGVRDLGPGIPQEAAARIFSAGYSTKRDRAGLGLALVRRILVRLGGEALVERDDAAGASILVTIPAR
jgi:signal transduction histidine kinase